MEGRQFSLHEDCRCRFESCHRCYEGVGADIKHEFNFITPKEAQLIEQKKNAWETYSLYIQCNEWPSIDYGIKGHCHEAEEEEKAGSVNKVYALYSRSYERTWTE